jgi:hypothetical protein
LRRARHSPGLVAIQHNAKAKRVFQRPIENGKPEKLAFAAVMRKLAILATPCSEMSANGRHKTVNR